jgi:hypothetical protein
MVDFSRRYYYYCDYGCNVLCYCDLRVRVCEVWSTNHETRLSFDVVSKFFLAELVRFGSIRFLVFLLGSRSFFLII